jgi:hypothetical protein
LGILTDIPDNMQELAQFASGGKKRSSPKFTWENRQPGNLKANTKSK